MKFSANRLLAILVAGTLTLSLFAVSGMLEQVRAGMRPHNVRNDWKQACPHPGSLRSGDLVFRRGRGFISNALCQFSLHDHRYSHAGILHIENGQVFVYHAIGGEGAISNRMRKEPLASFCSPEDAQSFAIYRLNLPVVQMNEVDSAAGSYYRNGLQFDTGFDLQTDDKMYCTELVYKILVQVTGNKNLIPLTTISGKTWVACENIQHSSVCSENYTYVYHD